MVLSGVAETLHPIARPGVVSLLLITTGTARITGHGSGLAPLWEELLPSSVEVVESLKTSLGLTDCTFLAATSEQLELDTDSAESEWIKTCTMKTICHDFLQTSSFSSQDHQMVQERPTTISV